MSSYTVKAKHKKTGVVYSVFCIDDFFGRHEYGYQLQEDPMPVLTEKQFQERYEVIKDKAALAAIQGQEK